MTTKKTLETFRFKSKSFMPVKDSMYRKYRKKFYYMLETTETGKKDDRTITCYANRKSFKDWCIEKGYIMRYRMEEEATQSSYFIQMNIVSLDKRPFAFVSTCIPLGYSKRLGVTCNMIVTLNRFLNSIK